jgi:hypothetical protein
MPVGIINSLTYEELMKDWQGCREALRDIQDIIDHSLGHMDSLDTLTMDLDIIYDIADEALTARMMARMDEVREALITPPTLSVVVPPSNEDIW